MMLKNTKRIIELAVQDNFEKHLEIYLEMYNQKKEIRMWLISLRVGVTFFVSLTLAGSIWGYYLFPTYIDSVVSKRIEVLDKLPIAISYAEIGDFDMAAIVLDDMWENVIENGKVQNKDFIRQYLINYLWVISSAEINDEYHIMSNRWKKLNSNKNFISFKKNVNSDIVKRNITIGEIKYDFKKGNEANYLKGFNEMILKAFIDGDKFLEADLLYQYAMFSLIFSREKIASEYLVRAHCLNPAEYHLSDWEKYKESYFNSPSYNLYEYVAKKYNILDLKKRHGELVVKAMSLLDGRDGLPCKGYDEIIY